MKKEIKETALVPVEESKALVIHGQTGSVDLPFDLDENDFLPQEEEALIYPYISIRQKDPREDVVYKTQRGWWKVANAPEPIGDIEPPLKVVVLFWHKARTLFFEGEPAPHCKSIDGNIGSLITEETANGVCANCQYAQWQADKRPLCAEGRNLYCFSQQIGPCIVRLGRSSIKAWRAFDNLMAVKRVLHKGRSARVPYHLSTIELETKKIVEGSFDPYWIVVPKFVGFIEDRDTLSIIRSLLPNKEIYDKVARKADLDNEDINGRKAVDVESDKEFNEIFPTAEEVRQSQAGSTQGKTGDSFLDDM